MSDSQYDVDERFKRLWPKFEAGVRYLGRKSGDPPMEGQKYITFSPTVASIVTGNWKDPEPITLPLFRELDPEEDKDFRQWSRNNYTPGEEIPDFWHPACQDEARRMNTEAGVSGEPKTAEDYGIENPVPGVTTLTGQALKDWSETD